MSAHSLDGAVKSALSGRAGASRPSITVEKLMGGARELVIVHAGEEYRLRVTSKGKLILTK